jgi:hypothetical protein
MARMCISNEVEYNRGRSSNACDQILSTTRPLNLQFKRDIDQFYSLGTNAYFYALSEAGTLRGDGYPRTPTKYRTNAAPHIEQ